jgi:hypothetical protein
MHPVRFILENPNASTWPTSGTAPFFPNIPDDEGKEEARWESRGQEMSSFSAKEHVACLDDDPFNLARSWKFQNERDNTNASTSAHRSSKPQ